MTIYSSQRPATAEEVYQDICDRITNLQLKSDERGIWSFPFCDSDGVHASEPAKAD